MPTRPGSARLAAPMPAILRGFPLSLENFMKVLILVLTVFVLGAYIRLTNDGGDAAGDQGVRSEVGKLV